MSHFKKQTAKSFVAVSLILCLIFGCTSVFALKNEDCDKALVKCSADAVIAGLLSGAQTFLIFSAGCLMGYSWCLKYYVS